jgi:DNA-binding GntR family transcriptional regulator
MPGMNDIANELGVIAATDDGSPATLSQTLYERLRGEIVGGRRLPGTKLRLDELRGQYGVSLSPLREALSRLAAEGFVVSENQRGFNVAPVSRAMFADVIKMRTALESMALRESIEKGGVDWEVGVVSALHRLKKFEVARSEGQSMDEWEQRHQEFHLALVDACGSPLLLQFCTTLRDLNDRYRRLFLASYKLDRDVANEHQAIADAALTHDAEKAAQLLGEHIQRTARNVFKVLDAKTEKAPSR